MDSGEAESGWAELVGGSLIGSFRGLTDRVGAETEERTRECGAHVQECQRPHAPPITARAAPPPHLREAKGVKLSAEGEQGPGGRGGAPAQKGLKRGLLVRLGERIQHNGDGQ